MREPHTLLLQQHKGIQPRRVRVFSQGMDQVGEATLGLDQDQAEFELPKGIYVVEVEQMGLPSQQIPIDVSASHNTLVLDDFLSSPSSERPSGRLTARRAEPLESAFLPRDKATSSRHRQGDERPRALQTLGFEAIRAREVLGEIPRSPAARLSLYPGLLQTRFEPYFLRDMEFIVGLANTERAPLFVEDSPFDPGSTLFLPVFSGEFTIRERGGAFQVSHDRHEGDGRNAILPALLAFVDIDMVSGGADFIRFALQDFVKPTKDADLWQTAYQLLRDKFLDPYQAAVAGYFLLRHNQFELLRDWTRNLADYFPFMSDGLILEGWRRLSVTGSKANPPWPRWRLDDPPPPTSYNPTPNSARPEDPIEDAATRFVEASRRGLPNFEFGCRKLLEGLIFCHDRLGRSARSDDRLLRELGSAAEEMADKIDLIYSTAGLTTLRAQ